MEVIPLVISPNFISWVDGPHMEDMRMPKAVFYGELRQANTTEEPHGSDSCNDQMN